MKYALFILVCCHFTLSAQIQARDSTLNWTTTLPKVVSNHPIGTFLTRFQANFGGNQKKPTFNIEYGMGNIWLPGVTAYYPTNEIDQAEGEQYPWHFRGSQNWQNPDSIFFEADGVLRTYLLSYIIPLSEIQHLAVTAKLYSLDGGKSPFSMVTTDRFTEWFHSNIAGGEDPFARKKYAFNQALIHYRDKEGNDMIIKGGDVGINGLELNYQYQIPSLWLTKRFFSLKGNVVLGANTSKFNRSIDIGGGILATKNIKVGQHGLFRFGASWETVNINAFNLNSQVDLTDRPLMFQRAFFAGWEKVLKRQRSISISTLFQIQTTYRKPEAKNYYALDGNRDVSHWHYALSHLYYKTYGNSLIVAYRKQHFTYSIYIREDLVLVDNAPDIQTGMTVNFSLRK